MSALGVNYLVPAAIVVGTFLFLIARRWLPWLGDFGTPIERSALRRAELAENELARAMVAIESQDAKIAALEKERSLEAVIVLVEKVSGGVDQTLAKLGELNGGLRHTADALKTTHEAMQASTKAVELLASQIIIDLQGG